MRRKKNTRNKNRTKKSLSVFAMSTSLHVCFYNSLLSSLESGLLLSQERNGDIFPNFCCEICFIVESRLPTKS